MRRRIEAGLIAGASTLGIGLLWLGGGLLSDAGAAGAMEKMCKVTPVNELCVKPPNDYFAEGRRDDLEGGLLITLGTVAVSAAAAFAFSERHPYVMKSGVANTRAVS